MKSGSLSFLKSRSESFSMENTRYLFSFLLISFLGLVSLHAQSSFQFFDAQDSSFIPYVKVQKRGSARLLYSDEKGRASLKVKEGDTLIFSSMGYQSYLLPWSPNEAKQVYLKADQKMLGAVTVKPRSEKVVDWEGRHADISLWSNSGMEMAYIIDPGATEFPLQLNHLKIKLRNGDNVVRLSFYTRQDSIPGQMLAIEPVLIEAYSGRYLELNLEARQLKFTEPFFVVVEFIHQNSDYKAMGGIRYYLQGSEHQRTWYKYPKMESWRSMGRGQGLGSLVEEPHLNMIVKY